MWLALLGAAWANGQTAHVWITREALDLLPPGELSDLLHREDLEPMLIHGTMFPDGGYPLGHPYGEAAHWEPFQMAYADWIKAHYSPPWTDEAAQHIAFLLGMASHGMADQTHDALYLDWSTHYDAEEGWARGESLDEATDFTWAGLAGPSEYPDRWIPDTVFVSVFASQGITVDEDTLNRGQGLLEAAITLVGLGAQQQSTLDRYAAQFPWGCAHLDDPDQPGTPGFEAEAVAAYWPDVYARLTDDEGPQHLLYAWPEDGAYKPTTAADALESRLALVLARGAPDGEVDPAIVSVQDEAGHNYAVHSRLYYGRDSHVLLVEPQEDWAPDATFTVTLKAGTPGRDGSATAAPLTTTFTTRPPTAQGAAPMPAKGCATAAGAGLLGLFAAVGALSSRRAPRG